MHLLGKVSNDINTWSLEKIRHYLLLNSAGFRIVIDRIIEKHRLKYKKKEKLNRRLGLARIGGDPELNEDVIAIIESLGIDRYLLETVLLNNGIKNHQVLDDYCLPVYTPPITGSGFYIRVSARTQRQTVLKAFWEIKKIFDGLNKNKEVKGKSKIINTDSQPKQLDLYIKLFLIIEKFIYDSYIQKPANTGLGEEDSAIYKDIYEEAGVKVFGALKKQGEKQYLISRVKDIYYTKTIKYYTLFSFKHYEELLEKIK